MIIKKVSETTPVQAEVVNEYSESTKNSYSCDYINNYASDYVVEQGISGNWTWRKWSSGLAECWCNEACTGLDCTNSSMGTYYGGQKTFTYPSGLFTSSPVTTVSVGKGSHSSGMYPYQANNTGITSCTVEFRAFASTTNGNCPVFIYSYGNWK